MNGTRPITDHAELRSPASAYIQVAVLAEGVQIDVSLPHDVPVGFVIPGLASMVRLDDQKREAWTLRRDGAQRPIPPGRTLRDTGVSDGDMLRLEPSQTTDTPTLYDDVVDAAARLNRDGLPGWSTTSARRVALAGTWLTSSIWVCFLLADPFMRQRALTVVLSVMMSIVLVCVATWANRVGRQADIGTALGWAAVPIAAAASWASLSALGGYALAAGCGVFIVLCWFIPTVVGAGHGGYVAAAVVFGAGGVILTAHAAGVATHVVGAITMASCVLGTLAVPPATARLTRPVRHQNNSSNDADGEAVSARGTDALTPIGAARNADTCAVPTHDVWMQARRVARIRAGLYTGLALAACIGLTLVVPSPRSWAGLLLAVSCAGVLVFRLADVKTAQEWSALLVGAVLLVLVGCLRTRGTGEILALAAFAFLIVAVASLAGAGALHSRRLKPVTRTGLTCANYVVTAAVAPLTTWAASPLDAWFVR